MIAFSLKKSIFNIIIFNRNITEQSLLNLYALIIIILHREARHLNGTRSEVFLKQTKVCFCDMYPTLSRIFLRPEHTLRPKRNFGLFCECAKYGIIDGKIVLFDGFH